MIKKRFLLGFVFLGLGLSAAWTVAGPQKVLVADTAATYRYVIKVPVQSPYEMTKYVGWLRQNGYDIPGFNWTRQEIEVITDAAGLKRLQETKMLGRVIEERVAGQIQISKVDERYLSPEKVEQKLKALATKFPQNTRLEQIGTSLEGRAIWALLISSTPNRKSTQYYEKPSIIFDGMHHAREIMTPEVVMDVADVLLNPQLRRNKDAAALLDTWNVWIVPMLNVDGNNIVWTKDNWWRKNARGQGNRVYGVDINRNYPFKWNSCNGSSGSPGAQDYRGPAAASEPETQALMKLAQLAHPTGALSYHSYSELVLYPFGCKGLLTGDNQLHAKVATELASLLPSDSRRGNYTPGSPWQILYAVDGDSMSYIHSEYGTLTFTFEINQEFQPPYSLREPTLQKHRKAWGYFIQRMTQNLLALKVIDGKTGQPAQARIAISQIIQQYGEKPFRTNPGGNFFKVLEPGLYNVQVQLQDGRQTVVNVEMKGQTQAQVITVN